MTSGRRTKSVARSACTSTAAAPTQPGDTLLLVFHADDEPTGFTLPDGSFTVLLDTTDESAAGTRPAARSTSARGQSSSCATSPSVRGSERSG